MPWKKKSGQHPPGDIHYWIRPGDTGKPWLVFLPGLSADHTLFEKQLVFFAGQYSCLAWDTPGHGRSRPFALNFSMADLARYLQDILTAEGILHPVLVGQSLGGYIAQCYMTQYPDSARGFVSIDSCSLSRKYYTGWELAALKNTGWMYRCIPWNLLLEWGVAGTAATKYGRDLTRKMWSSYRREEYCDLAEHGTALLAEAVEARPEYPISCPVLLLCGELDYAGSSKSYNRRWTKQDGHRLVWIKGAGHNANTDAPDRANQLIREFVQTL